MKQKKDDPDSLNGGYAYPNLSKSYVIDLQATELKGYTYNKIQNSWNGKTFSNVQSMSDPKNGYNGS